MGNFWAILAILGHFGPFWVVFGPFFGANFVWPKIYLCYFYYFFHLCLSRTDLERQGQFLVSSETFLDWICHRCCCITVLKISYARNTSLKRAWLVKKMFVKANLFTFSGRTVTNLWEKFNTYPANLLQQIEEINLWLYTYQPKRAWQWIREDFTWITTQMNNDIDTSLPLNPPKDIKTPIKSFRN